MPIRYALCLSLFLIVAVACGGTQAVTSALPSPASTGSIDEPASPMMTGSAYQTGSPMTTQADAVAAAERDLEEQGFKWTVPPQAVLVEEMSYEQAKAMIGHGDTDADYQFSPRETRVWFVIVQGKWTLEPMGPEGAAPIPYEGCLLRVFQSRDGSLLAAGDSVCPR